jgi:alpha-1,3-rhamnosyltransferase
MTHDPSSSEPLVTMLIPSYNHEKFIEIAIRSVIVQDYPNIELLIIDDGSSDLSFARIKEMSNECADRFVRFEFFRQANEGLASVINCAIQWGRGKYFATLASDDAIVPNKTSRAVGVLENHSEVSAVCGASIEIDGDGRRIGKMVTADRLYSFEEIVLHDYVLSAPTQLVRLDMLRAMGGIPRHIIIEDWYIWIRLTENGSKIMTISETLAYYRRHTSNLSSKYERLLAARLDVLDYAKCSISYKKSSSRVYLMSAIDYSSVKKSFALYYVLSALRLHGNCVFSWQFRYAVLRILTPILLLKFLKYFRVRLRRLVLWTRGRPSILENTDHV